MQSYFLIALIVSVIGVIPLAIRARLGAAAALGICSTLLFSFLFWWTCATAVGPLGGAFAWVVLLLWIICAVIDGVKDHEPTYVAAFPVILGLILIGGALVNGPLFRSKAYANVIGKQELSVWTQDVQPKHPSHMRMSTLEYAEFSANKRVGELGAVGSQFQVSKDHITPQMVAGELWYLAPLDHKDFGTWQNADGIPGFIRVNGEDPHAQAEMVEMKDRKMVYSPGAFFDHNLERHLRYNGYMAKGLTDYNFEVDDAGSPWWVVSVYEPTIWSSAPVVQGVVIVNPFDGKSEFFAAGKVPDWIDRVYPAAILRKNLEWHGKYHSGWLNSWFSEKDLTEPETPNLIYGNDNQPEWVVGVTSTGEKDDSLVALVYTNSRTGKLMRYTMKGGATDEAVKDAVDKYLASLNKKLHAVDPQLYNIDGIPVAVCPLLSENHAFQGTAAVSINDLSSIGIGTSQHAAIRDFKRLLTSRATSKDAVTGAQQFVKLQGVVDRIATVSLFTGGAEVQFHLAGAPHVFTADATMSPKLPLTQVGDAVAIECVAGAADIRSLRSFDNLSLPLLTTPAQDEVRARVEGNIRKEEAKSDAATVEERVKQMPADPDALRKLKAATDPNKQ